MNKLFSLNNMQRHQEAVDEWLASEPLALFSIARQWFNAFRACGDDVMEGIHDGCPVACVGNAAFGYVNVFRNHVNVGFFHGAGLHDPHRLLEGSGRRMRHVKIRPDDSLNEQALVSLIQSAYRDVKSRRGESP